MKVRLKLWVKLLLISLVLISGLILYSRYIGTNGLIVKEYSIVNDKIPNSFYGLKIVHISDIHYKVTTTKENLEKIVNKINLLKPDIVIFSGDLFDKNIKYKEKDYKDLTKLLKSIDYNIEKFAIKGEDDLKVKNWEKIINDSDFKNLNNTYEFIYSNGIEPILLVGVESNYKNLTINQTINDIYSELNTEYNYSILIMHEPDLIDKIDYSKFNLILAGHSHNGQIILPFVGGIIKDKYSKKYLNNYYELNNTRFFISSGIGTTKYKFRFLNKPSINLYRLRNK